MLKQFEVNGGSDFGPTPEFYVTDPECYSGLIQEGQRLLQSSSFDFVSVYVVEASCSGFVVTEEPEEAHCKVTYYDGTGMCTVYLVGGNSARWGERWVYPRLAVYKDAVQLVWTSKHSQDELYVYLEDSDTL